VFLSLKNNSNFNIILIQEYNYYRRPKFPKQISISYPGTANGVKSYAENCGEIIDQKNNTELKKLPRLNISSHYYHDCSTTHGSSGSPLFNSETGQAIGIHHANADKKFPYNRATFLYTVMRYIEDKSPELYDEIVY
jgi:hypothetical protein